MSQIAECRARGGLINNMNHEFGVVVGVGKFISRSSKAAQKLKQKVAST
jgi:hypothetical protein